MTNCHRLIANMTVCQSHVTSHIIVRSAGHSNAALYDSMKRFRIRLKRYPATDHHDHLESGAQLFTRGRQTEIENENNQCQVSYFENAACQATSYSKFKEAQSRAAFIRYTENKNPPTMLRFFEYNILIKNVY